MACPEYARFVMLAVVLLVGLSKFHAIFGFIRPDVPVCHFFALRQCVEYFVSCGSNRLYSWLPLMQKKLLTDLIM